MDKLLKALAAAGLKVGVPQEGQSLTTVTVEGEQLAIRLYEGIGRFNHVPTDEERVRIKKYPEIHGVPEWDERPNGKLNLVILHEEFRGVRMRWTDGKGNPLENKVGSFVEGLVEAARAKRAWRKEKEEEQCSWEEQRRKEDEAATRRYEEQQRAERLKQQVDDWSRSRLIREYIADMQAVTLNPGKWNFSGIPLPEWMEWALGYADHIDPIGPIRRDLAVDTADKQQPPARSDSRPTTE